MDTKLTRRTAIASGASALFLSAVPFGMAAKPRPRAPVVPISLGSWKDRRFDESWTFGEKSPVPVDVLAEAGWSSNGFRETPRGPDEADWTKSSIYDVRGAHRFISDWVLNPGDVDAQLHRRCLVDLVRDCAEFARRKLPLEIDPRWRQQPEHLLYRASPVLRCVELPQIWSKTHTATGQVAWFVWNELVHCYEVDEELSAEVQQWRRENWQ